MDLRNKRYQIKNSRNSCNQADGPSQKRKIKPTRRSVSGVYAFKGSDPIPFESTLERDFLIRAEFSLSVAQIIPQPVEVPFIGRNGKNYTYTPDFLVYHQLEERHYEEYPKPQLVEVKPSAQWRANWREWSPKWKAALSLSKVNGWTFHIHDESRIRDQLFENVRFLQRFKRSEFDESENLLLLETVNEMRSVPMHYLLAKHYIGNDHCIGINHVWHLVATKRLACDMCRKLNANTALWIPDHVG